ncbi:expressed unknown protein [Ectocarpus siliculosus]|uniref:Uncharacterized protein n=1 Tax=Ectocarpus siliculosus TaxID=2880 RepID=D7G3L8_ECTSI|nr:expressed unknown protein [Ectocarpus siliculosus]|eukprot:CBJ33550.1 expressed unknown protein [Ectocarpus siliculosus]
MALVERGNGSHLFLRYLSMSAYDIGAYNQHCKYFRGALCRCRRFGMFFLGKAKDA